ncbi:MAG TPA: hypothetical protein VMP11_02295 [Verrucomicrobiae bacterium]|nr:hypothetical protein [Verrucomicrobiae bacterium]
MDKQTVKIVFDLCVSIGLVFFIVRSLVCAKERPAWARISILVALCLWLAVGVMRVTQGLLGSRASWKTVLYLGHYRTAAAAMAFGVLFVLAISGELLRVLGLNSLMKELRKELQQRRIRSKGAKGAGS